MLLLQATSNKPLVQATPTRLLLQTMLTMLLLQATSIRLLLQAKPIRLLLQAHLPGYCSRPHLTSHWYRPHQPGYQDEIYIDVEWRVRGGNMKETQRTRWKWGKEKVKEGQNTYSHRREWILFCFSLFLVSFFLVGWGHLAECEKPDWTSRRHDCYPIFSKQRVPAIAFMSWH
jgi:hypothetical protein